MWVVLPTSSLRSYDPFPPSGLEVNQFRPGQSHPIPFERYQHTVAHVHTRGVHRHKQEHSYTPKGYTWTDMHAYATHWGWHICLPTTWGSLIQSPHKHSLHNQCCSVVRSEGSAASSRGSNPGSAPHELCDLEHVPEPLWASFSSPLRRA